MSLSREFVDLRAPSLGDYYFLSLTLSVCLSVTLLLQIDSSFLFLGGIEPFLGVSSSCGTLQGRSQKFVFLGGIKVFWGYKTVE